ncbi:hypothetical protein CAEBREN_05089 [Caenorhabditis brenneri]|uniref:Zinc finger PHD-type domain-containing protein n=1 Tax=Caenorhabditis brenneri TaxID=135651 RepID=G0NBM1_CAEBE|nr:hypothetical protein CAEBREN_05089 [Caenorhabditis brenneri]
MEFPFPDDSLEVHGVKCVCGLKQPPGTNEERNEDWVLCERCKSWQHQICVGIIPPRTEIGRYHCPECRSRARNEWTMSDDKRLWEKFTKDAVKMLKESTNMENWCQDFATENGMTHAPSTIRNHFKKLTKEYLEHDFVKDVKMKIFCAIASMSRLSDKLIDDFKIHGEVFMTPGKKIVAFIETGKVLPLYSVPKWGQKVSRRHATVAADAIEDLPPLPNTDTVLANANMVLEARRLSGEQEKDGGQVPPSVSLPKTVVTNHRKRYRVDRMVTSRLVQSGQNAAHQTVNTTNPELADIPDDTRTISTAVALPTPPVVGTKKAPNVVELATSIAPNVEPKSEKTVANQHENHQPLDRSPSQHPSTSEAANRVQNNNLLPLDPLPKSTTVEDMDEPNGGAEMETIDCNQQTAEAQHTRIKEEDEESAIKRVKFEKEREIFRPPAEQASVFDFLFSLGCFLSTLSVKNAYLEEFVNDMKRKIIMKIGVEEKMEYSSIAESLTNVFDSSLNNAKRMETIDEKFKGEVNVLPDPREYLDLTTFLRHLENFVGQYNLTSNEFGKLRKRIQEAIQESVEEGKRGHGKFLKITSIKRRVWFIYDRHGFIDDED